MNILVIDNFDSFTYILVQYLGELGASPTALLNDQITVPEITDADPDGILISPGPGVPQDAGVSMQVVDALWQRYPILGVCLGHQVIAEVFGGRTVRAAVPMHGKTSSVDHTGAGVFEGLPTPATFMRYHSLVAAHQNLPEQLERTAWTGTPGTDSFELMGIQHRERPVYGVQFHPESIGSPHGKRLLENFLRIVAGRKNRIFDTNSDPH